MKFTRINIFTHFTRLGWKCEATSQKFTPAVGVYKKLFKRDIYVFEVHYPN
jgi:hypothetical protein